MIQLPTLYAGAHEKGVLHRSLTEDLQQFLRGRFALDKPPLVVDGEFGTKTTAAVKKYQLLEHVQSDGIVGPTTWGKLLVSGFRPTDYEPEPTPGDAKVSPAWPPKPAAIGAPNGMQLFGKGFSYKPNQSESAPDAIAIPQTWVTSNISTARIPQLKGVPGMVRDSGTIPFNKALVPQVEALFATWEKQGLSRRVLSFGGSWVPRFVRGRQTVSNHALGTAFDINAQWNPYKSQPALVGKVGCVRELVPTALLLGFYWGGWYNDGMHFEAYKVLSAEDLARTIAEILK